ncbi:MAG: bifunctional diguanylate cyclase/phosphohydrolase [Peptostreptococcaceae bacterium]
MEKSKIICEHSKRQEFDNRRSENVFRLVIILKILYIMLALIATLSKLGSNFILKDNIVMVSITGCIILIMMNYYLSWSVNYTKDRVYEKSQKRDYVESIALIVIFVLVLGINRFESDYKILSILAVIIGAIQFGQIYSCGVSLCYTIIILGLDLLAGISRFQSILGLKEDFHINNFEKDLVLVAVLFIISVVVGMYVDIERKYFKELKKVANMDELTGIYNHRYFQESLTNMIRRADDNNTELSLLFMDIDYFKHYNDTHGHQVGDSLLREVGKILKSSTRDGDVVARYGGEEFAVILPSTDQEDAIKVGERIRKNIEKYPFKGQESQPNKNVTMSIGVSTYPSVASSKYDLIETADHALYKAKAFNRNRVEYYRNILDELYGNKDIDREVLDNLRKFVRMINQKDKYTYGHTERVVTWCKSFGRFIKLSYEEQIKLQIGAYIHDIGKFNLGKDVLNKKNNLNDDEFEVFKTHCSQGVDFIKSIDCLEEFIPIVKYHHERYDGRGYPDGLKGDEIPYLARILTIIDSFDSNISSKQYTSNKVIEEAKQDLIDNAGTLFDPKLVLQFAQLLEEHDAYI